MQNYGNEMAGGKSNFTGSYDVEYQRQMACEPSTAGQCSKLRELPAIHHYWSTTHLAEGKFQPFGITDSEHFFYLWIQKYHERFPARNIQILSIGMGDCDMESRLAGRLLGSGLEIFEIECVDINAANVKRALNSSGSPGAASAADYVVVQSGRIDKWLAAKSFDIVLCNQSLHQAFELEYMLALIEGALADDGMLLVSGAIGRNGHQVWPEALGIVEEFWRQVPARYKYNHVLDRLELRYSNHDYSIGMREGMRSQDVLPLLYSMFNFRLFIPFAAIIPVFVDQPFGYNFNAASEWDQDFIDRVHERDEQCILAGELKPTQMLGVLCKETVETKLVAPRLTPGFCIRHTSNA